MQQKPALTKTFTNFNCANLRLEYDQAVNNLRGRLRSLNQYKIKQARTEALNAQTILGTAPLDDKKGLAALTTIKGDKLLDKLSERILAAAVNYFHALLSDWSVNEHGDSSYVNHIVIGLSGGADSTLALVLAHAMRESFGYEVEAVHCIHKLDPDDDIWLNHNIALCERFKIKLSTPELNIRYDLGLSPEEVSRNERYLTLCTYLNDKSMLFMGHQADDMAESFLLALKRGSGPQGLQGMKYLTSDKRGLIVRPLLDLHKIEVEQILESLAVPTVFDLSNSYTKFERNFVRLRVMPLMRERFVGIDDAILRSQELIRVEHDLANRFVKSELAKHLKEEARLSLKYFDYESLDLNDYNLCVMLLRAFFKEVLSESVEFNYVESLYALMLGDNDRNGELRLEVGNECYIATTFKKRAYLFKQDYFKSAAHTNLSLNLNLSATTHAKEIQQQVYLTNSKNHNEKEVNTIPVNGVVVGAVKSGDISYMAVKLADNAAQLSYMINAKEDINSAKTNTCRVGLDKAAHIFLVPNSCSQLQLDFSYANSQKLKPRARPHSRELKKLFIEYNIPHFMRKLYPLIIRDDEVLGLGGIFSCGARLSDELSKRQDELYNLVPLVLVPYHVKALSCL